LPKELDLILLNPLNVSDYVIVIPSKSNQEVESIKLLLFNRNVRKVTLLLVFRRDTVKIDINERQS
jgi:hypothetical protein